MKNNKLWSIIVLLFILCGCEIDAGTHVEYNTETGVVNVTVSEYQDNIEALVENIDGGMEAVQKTIAENSGIDVEFVITPKSEYRLIEEGKDSNDYSVKYSFASIEDYNKYMSSKINDNAVTIYDGLLLYAFSPYSNQYINVIIDDTIRDLSFNQENIGTETIAIDHTFSVRNQFSGVWEIGNKFPRQDQVFDRHMYVEYKKDFWGNFKPNTVKVQFTMSEDIEAKIIEELISNSYVVDRVETGYRAQRSYDATTNVMAELLSSIFFDEMNETQFYGFLDIDCKSNIFLSIYNISQCSTITDNIRTRNIEGDKLKNGFILPNISGMNVYGDFEVHYMIDGQEALISDQSVIEILGFKRMILVVAPVFLLIPIIAIGIYRRRKNRNKYPLS